MDARQLLGIDAQLRTKPGRGRTYEPDWPNLLQRTETVGTPDLKAWARAVLEQPDGEPALVFQVAGMQDHRYHRTPWATPVRGSRVELLHNPENPADPDAVEVRNDDRGQRLPAGR